MTPAHDAIANATQGEVLSPFSAVVSFVGIDDLLVTADQMVGLLAFVDVGRRDKNAADDATGLVHRCMQLVAEVVFALLLGPGCIGIVLTLDELAGGTAGGIGRQRFVRPLGSIHRRRHQRSVN